MTPLGPEWVRQGLFLLNTQTGERRLAPSFTGGQPGLGGGAPAEDPGFLDIAKQALTTAGASALQGIASLPDQVRMAEAGGTEALRRLTNRAGGRNRLTDVIAAERNRQAGAPDPLALGIAAPGSVPSSFGRLAQARPDDRVEDARQGMLANYQEEVENLAGKTAHLPTPVAAGIYGASELAGMALDPTNVLPGAAATTRPFGAGSRLARQLAQEATEGAGRALTREAAGSVPQRALQREARGGSTHPVLNVERLPVGKDELEELRRQFPGAQLDRRALAEPKPDARYDYPAGAPPVDEGLDLRTYDPATGRLRQVTRPEPSTLDDELAALVGLEPPRPKPAPAPTGEAGFVSVQGVADVVKSLHKAERRWLQSGGEFRAAALDFPKGSPEREWVEGIPKLFEGREFEYNAEMVQVQRAQDQLTAAVKRNTKDQDAADQMYRQLYAWRATRRGAQNIPQEVLQEATTAFGQIDNLTGRLVASGLLKPAVAKKAQQRVGRYWHRQYRAWKDPNYLAKVEKDQPLWDSTFQWMKKRFPGKTDDQVVGYMRSLVSRTTQDVKRMREAGAPRLINAIVQKRKDPPSQLRKFLGEERDARLALEGTVHNMAWDLAMGKALRQVKEEGLQKGVIRAADDPSGQIFTQLPGPEGSALGSLSPFEGERATKDFARAIAGHFEEVRANWWMKTAGVVKVNKTALSASSHTRNFQGHGLTAVANGRVPLMPELTGRTIKTFRDENLYLDAVRHGIAREGAATGELADYIKWVEQSAVGPLVERPLRLAKASKDLYQAEDDFWRIYNWHGETKDLQRFLGLPLDEAKRLAADRVRDTVQTYGRLPKIADALRRSPVFAPFSSFRIESARNIGNIARLAASDIATGLRTGNKGQVALGLKKASGLIAAGTSAYAIKELRHFELGIDDEREEAIRYLAPEYLQNAELIVTDFTPGESAAVYDYGNINPYSGLTKPATAALRAIQGDVPWYEPVTEFLEEVAGPELLVESAAEIAANGKLMRTYPLPEFGPPIYGEMSPGKDIAYHAYRGTAPQVIAQGENLARGAGVLPQPVGYERDLKTEALAVAGHRWSDINFPEKIKGKSSQLANRHRDAVREARERAKAHGVKAKLVEEYMTSWRELYAEARKIARSGAAVGMTPLQIAQAMSEGELPSQMISAAAIYQTDKIPMPNITPQEAGDLPLGQAVVDYWREEKPALPDRVPFELFRR